MKKILDVLRGARRIELCLAAAAVAILLMMCFDGQTPVVGQTQQEARLGSMLSRIDGAGNVEVMLSEDGDGVLVIADGAQDIAVCLRIQHAVQILTEVDAARIEIVPRAE